MEDVGTGGAAVSAAVGAGGTPAPPGTGDEKNTELAAVDVVTVVVYVLGTVLQGGWFGRHLLDTSPGVCWNHFP
jgi:hypothetical protein